ncbi:hypothetical protein AAG747_20260 [Rapidithrix thailandica]|uniref:Uncharacterized protein n=1 Tax=Rapidithrix thailandica TaxID=413964 RepID=A0AAW9SD62_9BACT
MNKLLLTNLFLILCGGWAQAQPHEATHHLDSAGRLYWNKKLPVYLWVSSTPDSAQQRLTRAAKPQYADPLYLDTEGLNYIRTRYAVDKETQNTVTPHQEVMLEIYADGMAPSIKNTFQDAQIHQAAGKTYYGSSLSIQLQSEDKMSGVKQIYYAVNSERFIAYTEPVQMDQQGEFEVKFYAVDFVGNASPVEQKQFIVDLEAPVSNLNVNGITKENVISLSSKIYLLKNDKLSGVKATYYKFDEGTYKVYNGKGIDFAFLEEGHHRITYYSEDEVGNKEQEKTFEFYLDKSAPLMAADILGDRYLANNQIYFSGRTKLKLTAIDNKVGVKEIKYSIDNGEFLEYQNPFYLPNVTGEHYIRYYSVDNLNNQTQSGNATGYEEFKHNVSKVYVDLTGPTLSHSINGKHLYRKDTLLIGPNNTIQLAAVDGESGLQKITYSFDGELSETEYTQPLTQAKEGLHQLEFFGYDNVNNRNVERLFFFTDHSAPKIFINFSVGAIDTKGNLDIYPAHVGIFLSATDTYAGLENIYYSLNDQAERLYSGQISRLKPNKKYRLKIRAVDYLGNSSTKEISFRTSRQQGSAKQ